MKKIILCISVLLSAMAIPSMVVAQDWVSMMKDPQTNFYDVQKAFNNYYDKASREMEREKRQPWYRKRKAAVEEESEISGFTQYKRWEWFMAPRVSPTGERFDPSQAWHEYNKYRQQYSTANAGNWTLIGPVTTPGLAGAGRLNFVRIDPNDPNTIYVGSPGGGLWKSTNGGVLWTTNTDNISQVIGCSDVAIDPNNSNILYLATGDGEGADTYSVGILKSTDGGLTWGTTGLSYYMGNTRQLSKILIDPTNSNNILAIGSAGIFRSTNAGVTFTTTQTGSFKDIEFKPGDPTTVYACGSEFYKSTNNGQSWTKITSGLPLATNVSRMAIAVTAADANYVYIIAGLPQPNYGTEGFYKSTNSGTNFAKISTPALGTQQWYDLAIASSPANSQEIVIGGQTDFIRSTDAGVNWSQNGGTTHVDYHDIVYIDATSYYVTSDGGIYKTVNSGSNWTNLNHNLAISEMYGFGQSATNANLIVQGWQDNGTNRYNGTNWSQILGGDGMLCFIDWNNDQNMWGEQYNGSLNKSTNGGASFSSVNGNITEAGAWVTPWSQDPVNSGTIYVGMVNMWKSTNGGPTWTKISTFANTATVTTFTVSPANNQVMWVAKPGNLYLTTNGGTSWTTITNVPSGTITGIACDNVDANKAWITYSGFSNKNKVFETNNQGASWTNLSASVPNIPVNCIVHIDNSNDGLYIGTDVGIFYKDATLSVWQPFYNGLPNVVVSQLFYHYGVNKLRASTYGRGMWESDPYQAGTYAPTAAFGSDKKIACPGAGIQFTDFSAGQPTSWSWTFAGGSPATSNQQNPLVSYNTSGTFPVTLTVTNGIGSDSVTYNSYITISVSPFPAPATVGTQFCGPATVNLSATGTGTGTLRWWDAAGGGNVVATGNTFSPTITGTHDYYVDEDFPQGSIDFVGPSSNGFGAGAAFTANDIRGLYFDVINPVILNSFDVYPNSAGNRTIEVLDLQGNTLIDTTIFMAASPTTPLTVTVNFTLYPGTGYFIKCRGYVDLFRNTGGASYPYTSNDLNITGSNAGLPGYYYFFYSWIFNTISCNTGRTICTASDTCAVIGLNSLEGGNLLSVYPNPNTGKFALKFNAAKADNYIVEIKNALGQIVYTEKLTSFAGEYAKQMDMTKFGKGVYMLSVSDSENKAIKRVMVY